jgi:hypothetical protein
MDDIWNYNPAGYPNAKWRKMENIKFPESESPDKNITFMRGGEECHCVCKPKFLPRNVILLRPVKPEASKPLYELMVVAWKRGEFKKMSQGSCQQAINTHEVRQMFRPIGSHIRVSCLDNVDGGMLRSGDILLTRIGDRNVGKPYRIL